MLAAIFGIISLGFLSENTKLGQRLTGVVIVILLSALLSNLGILPSAAPLYESIWSIGVPLAVALYLLRANLFSIVRQGGRTLIAFLAGTVGVVIGAILGVLLFDLGPHEAELAAVFSATYSGGSLNFAAVAEAINFNDSALLTAGVAVDNVLGIGFFALLSGLAGFSVFQKLLPWRAAQLFHEFDGEQTSGEKSNSNKSKHVDVGAKDLGIVIALAAGFCAIASAIGVVFDASSYRILFISLLSVAFATFGGSLIKLEENTLNASGILATLIMYAFFVMLGAGAVISEVVNAPASVIPFVLVIFLCHGIVTLLVAFACRLNYGEVIVASIACIGGPPIAIAYAVLFGWRQLAGPAIATGVLGYAIGNFVGIGVYNFVGYLHTILG